MIGSRSISFDTAKSEASVEAAIPVFGNTALEMGMLPLPPSRYLP